MKPIPKFGVYAWWPEAGTDWIHPHDRSLAQRIIPSSRVFYRSSFEDGYYHLRYGNLRLRVRPTLWLVVPGDGFHVGDMIEVRSRGGTNEAFVGRICEMRWHRHKGYIRYVLLSRRKRVPRWYLAEDLRHVDPKYRLRIPAVAPTPTRLSTD
jgi:hypothetical protein